MSAQPDLRVEGDHFTVNGAPKFLILISYFDALRVNPATLDSDFALIRSWNIDGVRILPNWWEYQCPTSGDCSTFFRSDTLLTPGGTYSATALNKLKVVLDKAAAHNLVVDLTFTRDTVCSSAGSAPPCGSPLGVTSYTQQIEGVLTQLASEPNRFSHVFVDFQNERDLGRPEQDLSESQVRTLADWAQGVWPSRPVMASNTGTSGTGTGPIGTQTFVANAHVDVVAYHDPRGLNWHTHTADIVDQLRPTERPIYL